MQKKQNLFQSNNLYNAREGSKFRKDQISVMNCGMEIKWTESNSFSRNSDIHIMKYFYCDVAENFVNPNLLIFNICGSVHHAL